MREADDNVDMLKVWRFPSGDMEETVEGLDISSNGSNYMLCTDLRLGPNRI